MSEKNSDHINTPRSSEYNQIFEKLVINTDTETVLGIVAYGIYKKSKWEWAQEIYKSKNRRPNSTDLRAYVDTWTPSQIDNAKKNAAQVLSEYADAVIQEAKPSIVQEALKGSFLKNLGTSVLAAFVYTLLLIAFSMILTRAGIDVLGVLERFATVEDKNPSSVLIPSD